MEDPRGPVPNYPAPPPPVVPQPVQNDSMPGETLLPPATEGLRTALLTETRLLGLRCLAENPGIRSSDISAACGMSREAVRIMLASLEESGLLIIDGVQGKENRQGKNVRYSLDMNALTRAHGDLLSWIAGWHPERTPRQ